MGKQHRSPNYPAIGLPEAVDLAKRLWDKEKRTPVSREAIAKAIGYSTLNGTARTKVSALGKYGLIEQVGKQSRISDLSVTIIHGQPTERLRALEAAARKVDLFAELIESHIDASDDSLKSHLIVEKGFSEDGAKAFIEAFSATKKLANLDNFSTITADERLGDDDAIGETDDQQTDRRLDTKIKRLERRTVVAGTKEATYPMATGEIFLQWPDRISADEAEDIVDWLAIMTRKIKRSVVSDEDEEPEADS